MKRTIKILIFISLIAFVSAGFKACTDPIKQAVKGGAVPVPSTVHQTTPKGATVQGTKKLSDQQLSLVDQGLQRAADNGAASGYTDIPEFSHYVIQIPPYDCVPSPEQRIPSFILRADNYDGTIYDQWNPHGKNVKDGVGVIYAAELVLSLGTPGSIPAYGWMYTCPDTSVLAEAVNNGREHMDIGRNDPDYYWATQTHATGGHPLLPHAREPTKGFAQTAPVSTVEFLDGNSFSGNGGVAAVVPHGAYVIQPVR